MFHYFTKLYNQMKQMPSVIYILLKYLCYACYRDKVYTEHAIYIYRGIHCYRGYNHMFGMVGAIFGSEITMI